MSIAGTFIFILRIPNACLVLLILRKKSFSSDCYYAAKIAELGNFFDGCCFDGKQGLILRTCQRSYVSRIV